MIDYSLQIDNRTPNVIEFTNIDEDEVGEEEDSFDDDGILVDDVQNDMDVDEVDFEWKETSDIINYSNIPHYFPPQIMKIDSDSSFDYFSLMFDKNIFDIMTEQTNIYAFDYISSKSDYLRKFPKSRIHKWSPVSNPDFRALLAVFILMGINKFPDQRGKYIFYKFYRPLEEKFIHGK